jgi:cell migration-inducing and hyaluronan-binding protein
MGRFSIAGNFSGFQSGPITNPIILQRKWQAEYTGGQTIRSGAELRGETSRDTLTLSLQEMDKGSFVIFELLEFTTAAAGTEQSSLAALKDTNATSYYKDENSLWAKLAVADAAATAVAAGPGGPADGGPGGGTRIDVSR